MMILLFVIALAVAFFYGFRVMGRVERFLSSDRIGTDKSCDSR